MLKTFIVTFKFLTFKKLFLKDAELYFQELKWEGGTAQTEVAPMDISMGKVGSEI